MDTMTYKPKETNVKRLKKYLNANTKTNTEREAKRFYDEMRKSYGKGISETTSDSGMLQ
jgi:mevalonate pyrophosphate decarboxylase